MVPQNTTSTFKLIALAQEVNRSRKSIRCRRIVPKKGTLNVRCMSVTYYSLGIPRGLAERWSSTTGGLRIGDGGARREALMFRSWCPAMVGWRAATRLEGTRLKLAPPAPFPPIGGLLGDVLDRLSAVGMLASERRDWPVDVLRRRNELLPKLLSWASWCSVRKLA